MDIEKLKAEFEQTECFKRLEHVAQYTFFEFGAYIKRTDVPADIEKKCGKLITALLFSWSAWKEAKAQAVPEGCLLMPRKCTNKMAHAAKAVDGRLSAFKYADVYGAMVEAAQEPSND